MRGLARAILALLLLLAGPAAGATRWFDPRCPTHGNGTSGTCGPSGPWKDKNAIPCGSLVAGDILNVKGGTHFLDNWNVNCSGASGNPVIIQNAPGEDLILDGTTDIKGSTWTARGGGVFECAAGTCGTNGKYPFRVWYQRGANVEEELTLDLTKSGGSFACTSGGLTAGTFSYQVGTPGHVCVRLSDGSTPSAATYVRIPTSLNAIALFPASTDHVTLRKNPAGGSFKIRGYRDHGIVMTPVNTGITIEGLDIGFVNDRCINDNGGAFQPCTRVIRRNYIHHCGQEGIDVRSCSGAGTLIEDNLIEFVQAVPWFPICNVEGPPCLQGFTDNGASIMHNAHNSTVRGNEARFYGTGGFRRGYGITLEHDNQHVLLENNSFHDATTGTASSQNAGYGIMIENFGASLDGTIIQNNRTWNTALGLAFNASTQPPPQTLTIRNNSFVNATRANVYQFNFAWGASARVLFQNNLVRSATPPSLGLLRHEASNPGMARPTTSLFHCPGCGGSTTILFWNGAGGAATVGATQAAVTAFQAGDVYGDPVLDLTGTSPSMALGPGSAARGAGATVSPSFPDYLGTPRPNGAWDIGAYQTPQGTPPPTGTTAPPTTTTRVSTTTTTRTSSTVTTTVTTRPSTTVTSSTVTTSTTRPTTTVTTTTRPSTTSTSATTPPTTTTQPPTVCKPYGTRCQETDECCLGLRCTRPWWAMRKKCR